jgi:hypothetical protein
MTDALLSLLDSAQALLWRIGVRFQWPAWLLDWAWDRQAIPYEPAKETGR